MFSKALRKTEAETQRKSLRSSGKGSARSSNVSTSSTASDESLDLPTNPLSILMAGGREVRMEGVLKAKMGGRFSSWKPWFVIVEEGRLRMTHSEDDGEPGGEVDSKSISKTFALPRMTHLKYSKRGSKDFSFSNDKGATVRLRAKNAEEAEVWLQHILQELKNQARLHRQCAKMMLENGETRGVIKLLRQTLKMWRLAVGDVHEKVIEAINDLAGFLLENEVMMEAEQLFEETKQLQKQLDAKVGSRMTLMVSSKGENAGLDEIRDWVELQDRVAKSADVVARNEIMRERERQLIEMMEDEHALKVQELQNRALMAERRAKAAELELATLKRPPKDKKKKSRLSMPRLGKPKKEANQEDDEKKKSVEVVKDEMIEEQVEAENEQLQDEDNDVEKKAIRLEDDRRRSVENKAESEAQLQQRLKELKAMKASEKKILRNESQVMQGSLQRSLGRKDETGACYLIYSPAGNGTLYAKWSLHPVEEAIGFFYPGERVEVKRFKFSRNGGKQELARNIGAAGKKYYEGVISFVKLAFDHQSVQAVLMKGLVECDVYLLRDDFIIHARPGVAFSTLDASAVSVVPQNNTAYKGIVKLPMHRFCTIGNSNGYSLMLQEDKRSSVVIIRKTVAE